MNRKRGPAQILPALGLGLAAALAVSTARADVVLFNRAPSAFPAVAGLLTNEYGHSAIPPLAETSLGYYKVLGTGPKSLNFRLLADTGGFLFSFGCYRYRSEMESIDLASMAGKEAFATAALSVENATLIFDDRLAGPGATQTVTLSGGDIIGFFVVPDATLVRFQTNRAAFAVNGVGSATFFEPGLQRWPLFSSAAANPGERDQLMGFLGTSIIEPGTSALLSSEDLSRADLPSNPRPLDNSFNDLAVAVNGIEPVQVLGPTAFVYEPFDYTPPPSSAANRGLGFEGPYTGGGVFGPTGLVYRAANGQILSSNGLSYVTTATPYTPAARKLDTQAVPAAWLNGGEKIGADGSIVYVGFASQIIAGALGSGFGGLFLAEGDETKLLIGVPTNSLTWGVERSGAHGSAVALDGAVHFLAARIEFKPGPESVRFYADPPLIVEPEQPSIAEFEVEDFAFDGLVLGSTPWTSQLDDIRVGPTYASIFGNPRPVFVTQPTNINLLLGSNTTLRGAAVGVGPITYQWYVGGTIPIPGAVNSSLVLSDAQFSQTGDYQVIAANAFASATGAVAHVRVVALPTIVDQIQPVNAVLGGDVTFRVSVANNATFPVGYRWRRNGTTRTNLLLNSSSSTFTITNVQASHAGAYDVIVTNVAFIVPGYRSGPVNLVVLGDADGDGMPDAWESAHGFNPNDASDAGGDADGDGMTNRQEYQAGTDPQNPSSYFKIDSLAATGPGSAALRFVSQAGTAYAVEYLDALDQTSWATLTEVVATGPITLVVDPSAGAARFYRVAIGCPSGTGCLYTANTAGVVRATVAPGLSRLGNPFNTGNNQIGEVIPTAPDGASVIIIGSDFDHIYVDGVGWIDGLVGLPSSLILAPGVPFYFKNPFSPITLTFVGELPLRPGITRHPASQTADAGSTITLAGEATGAPVLHYQWQHNGVEIPGATHASLILAGAQPSQSGDYRLKAFSSYGEALSLPATVALTSLSVPVITLQPAGQTVLAGSPVTFEVQASGVPAPAYQWRRDGIDLAGANQAILHLASAQPAQAGGYTVVVSNSLGKVTSQVAPLTVNEPAAIEVQPASQAAILGAPAVFSVQARGTAPLQYQWRKGGTPLLGATGPMFSIGAVAPADAGSYTVDVSNVHGSATSASATLTVLVPPGITQPPVDTTLNLGEPLMLCVTATGSNPLGFQWRKNGVNIPQATGNCYTVDPVQLSDGGSYSVVVANAAGAVETDPVTVVVTVIEVPPGDNFAARVPITSSLFRASSAGATKETGEPNHAGQPGGASVWYTFHADAGGILTVRTSGSSFDTLLGVYRGTAVGALTPVASDEDNGGFFGSEARCNVQAGEDLEIAIDGFDGASGDFALSWELAPSAHPLPEVLVQPASQTVAAGGSATFTVQAQGGTLTYQWYFNGARRQGATGPSLTVSDVQRGQVGTYSVAITNEFNLGIFSAPAVLEIGPVAGVQSADKISNPRVSGGGGGMAVLPVRGKGGAGAAGLAATGGILVGAGTTGTQLLNNTNALTQPGEPNHCGALGGSTRWLVLQPAVDGLELGLDTRGSAIETIVAIYTRENILTPLVEVACAKGAAAVDGLLFPAESSRQYWVAVDGVNGAQGIIQLNWRLGRPPVVTAEVVDNEAPVGGSIILKATASASVPPPTYQWYFNSTPLNGQTGQVLLLDAVTPEQAGDYYVVVRNDVGVVTQRVATVHVELAYAALARSDFNASTEQWMVLGGSQAAEPEHQATGGSSGGYVRFSVNPAPETRYWLAPPLFTGNQSGAYGGELTYELLKSPTLLNTLDADVMLAGAGQTLVFATSQSPGPAWTRFAIPLVETSGWKKETLAGPAPSREEMLRVLANLTHCLIRGTYSAEPHSIGLDRVSLVAPAETQMVVLRASYLPTGQLVLEWPESAGAFQLEASTRLDTPDWAALSVLPQASQGLKRAILDAGGSGMFYRLVKP